MKMKVVILAGGLGSRLSEETSLKPKPMVEIGGRPILWHIMKLYSYYGFDEFVICLGYKGYVIKEYFINYCLHMSDVTVDIRKNTIDIHQNFAEPWNVSLIDTGESTQTGGRIKRIQSYVNDDPFMMTYGDGVSDIDINKLTRFHSKNKKLITMTAVQQPGRFGSLIINATGEVESFVEKPLGDGAWINGGFFVMEPEIFDYIADDQTSFEREPLESLTRERKMAAYKHSGFWLAMDTMRDKNALEALWNSGKAPWKVWT
jgi:glucose-1-phosphate cytidylyltransferase